MAKVISLGQHGREFRTVGMGRSGAVRHGGETDLNSRIIAEDGTPGHSTEHAFPARFSFDPDQHRKNTERMIGSDCQLFWATPALRADQRGGTMASVSKWL